MKLFEAHAHLRGSESPNDVATWLDNAATFYGVA